MLLQVRELLAQRFGIYATGPYMTESGDRKRPMYYLNINTEAGIRAFHASIPLYGIKLQRAAEMMRNWKILRNNPTPRLLREKPRSIGVRLTYDIEVAHPDHLFVLANGLIVSNSGGVVGGAAGAIGGFKAINNLVQSPERYPGGAVHSQVDGRVQSVAPAPQGGHYITIDGKQHYSQLEPTVKRGDEVEAGDTLSKGIPIPSEIVKYKGIGEGRRYFVDAFRKTMDASNTYGNRRNIELVARGLINHVRLDDEFGDWSPGDVVPYQTLERSWQPRDGAVMTTPHAAMGHYLEQPVLHYTVGTKIGRQVANQLGKHGVTTVQAHRQPPPFSPVMIRGMANIGEDPDPFTRFIGSYQERNLLKAVHRGEVSDTAGSSYVPALMEGTSFGKTDLTQGWKPEMPTRSRKIEL